MMTEEEPDLALSSNVQLRLGLPVGFRRTDWNAQAIIRNSFKPNKKATRMDGPALLIGRMIYPRLLRRIRSRAKAPMARRTKVEGSGTGANAKPIGSSNPVAKVD